LVDKGKYIARYKIYEEKLAQFSLSLKYYFWW